MPTQVIADKWCASVKDEFDRGYRLGRHDALMYAESRVHEGDEDTFEGYNAGYTAMRQWLVWNKAWHTLNKELGTQHPDAQKAYYKCQQCHRVLEEMDEVCGLNGPKEGVA